jgi:hypothetical protein
MISLCIQQSRNTDGGEILQTLAHTKQPTTGVRDQIERELKIKVWGSVYRQGSASAVNPHLINDAKCKPLHTEGTQHRCTRTKPEANFTETFRPALSVPLSASPALLTTARWCKAMAA